MYAREHLEQASLITHTHDTGAKGSFAQALLSPSGCVVLCAAYNASERRGDEAFLSATQCPDVGPQQLQGRQL